MKKILFLIIVFLYSSVSAMDIYSNNAILYNLNEDSVIYEKNSDDIVQIASLTKIVTAITVIENVSNLDDRVTIKYDMLTGLDGYAKIGLQVGDSLSYRELLYLLILNSVGDAAKALAISVGGSIDGFSVLMNDKVSKIGVNNTKFDNPVGMDSINNYSTVSDLAIILKYCLNNKIFKEIFDADEYYIKSLNVMAKKTVRQTGIKYNLDTTRITGAKTGFTYDAGNCLASTSSYDGIDYLLVTTNAPIDYPYHVVDAINVYDYYENNYAYLTILSKDELLYKIPIINSDEEYYEVKADYNIIKYLKKDTDLSNIEYRYSGISNITNNIKNGEYLGHIDIILDNNILDSYDVYLNKDIKYKNNNILDVILIVIFVIIALLIFLIFIKNRANRLKKSF